jgi:SOS-response transcriptional repressor LexA
MVVDLGLFGTPQILRKSQITSQAESADCALRVTQNAAENCRMTVGTEIRRRRKALKWTLEDLAAKVDSDTGNLSRMETGKQGVTEEMLRRIAQALGCTVADFYSGGGDGTNVEIVPLGTRRIPLISFVQAGLMSEAFDAYEPGAAGEWLLTDLELSSGAFALRIKGDSMLPEFREGDVVIIDPQVAPSPGDFVVAKNGENEATFKKFRPRGINESGQQVVELVPLNEDYPSMRSDIVQFVIIGTMIEHRRYRRR